MHPIAAHLGHWYAAAPFFGPVGVIFAWLALQSARERRRD